MSETKQYVPKTWSGKHKEGTCPCCGRELLPVHVNTMQHVVTKLYNCFDCNINWEESFRLVYDGFHDGKYIYGPDGDAFHTDSDKDLYERNFVRGGGVDNAVRN